MADVSAWNGNQGSRKPSFTGQYMQSVPRQSAAPVATPRSLRFGRYASVATLWHVATITTTIANISCTHHAPIMHPSCTHHAPIMHPIMHPSCTTSCTHHAPHHAPHLTFFILTTSHSREIQTNNHNYYIIYNCWGIALELRNQLWKVTRQIMHPIMHPIMPHHILSFSQSCNHSFIFSHSYNISFERNSNK